MPLAQSRIHLLIQDPMMHRFMNAVPAAILLSLTACNASSEKTAGTAAALPDVQLPELSLATLQEVTKELSQDSYKGRAPGTPGEEKTVSYLIQKFTEAGLQPGNKGSWTQDVPLVEITAKNVSPLSFSGGATQMSLKYGSDFVAASYRVQPNIEVRSEEQPSDIQSLMRISYAVFCLKKK